MNATFNGTELVAQWRNGEKHNNPAGPLFAAGEFAETDITNAAFLITGCCLCSGSATHPCC